MMSFKKSLLRYFKKHKMVTLICLLSIICFTILTLTPPWILKYFIDEIIYTGDKHKILLLGLMYMGSYFVMNIFNTMKQVLLVVISQGISRNLREDMLKKVGKLTYTDFTRFDAGTLEAYFSNDVDAIDTLITSGVVSLVIDLFKIIGILVSLFIYSILFGSIVVLVLPIVLVFAWIMKQKMLKVQMRNRRLEGNVNNSILENLENINTIKSYRVYDSITDRYNDVLKNHFKTAEKTNLYDAMFSPIIQIIKAALITIIVVLASYKISLFDGMTIGMIVSGIDLITEIFTPIEKLGDELQTIQKSMAGIHRISEFFTLPEDEDKNLDILDLSNVVLEFKNVSYSYDGKVDVIKNFNLRLENTMHLTLEGRSGAGKSTIFKLAYGMIKPTAGSVTINGIPTYYLNDLAKRKVFGIVYQDYFFTNKTIYEEITLNRDFVSEERVYEVLDMCGLSRIDDINKTLNITDYSTGELSLFNIARAILLDNKILFLDEMNAKIDIVTAASIMNVINRIGKDKMILSINHYGDLIENSSVLHIGE